LRFGRRLGISPSVSPVHPSPILRPEDQLDLRLLRAANVLFSRIYHRVQVVSPQHLPRSGAGILVANHISGLDPLLIQSVCPRLIVWMMAREYYEISQLNGIFRAISAIPVDRSGRDMAATRSALRALEKGRILGIFPEGKIEPTRELLPFQTGVALMAARTGVPIYPAYVEGTQRNLTMKQAYLQRQEAVLAFGQPMRLEGRPNLDDATARIQTSVETLRQAATSVQPGR